MERIDRLLKPDGKNLSAVVFGKAGSGKSTAIEEWAKSAIKSRSYGKDWRLIYVSPKHEGFEGMKIGKKKITPQFDIEEVVGSLQKNRMAIWFPENMNSIDLEFDFLVSSLYDYKEANPNFSATIILDDAQVWVEARKTNSNEMKRLILTGRSKQIKTVLVSHGLVINKMLEGQVDLIVAFDSGNPIWWKSAQDRFNLDLETHSEALKSKPYSFLWYDMKDENPILFDPIQYN
tara:strand:+ start:2500 stop:3198 length:699 start_codon:yes stop_codon:yes gene_type:complete